MVNLNAFANAEDFVSYAGKQAMPLPDKNEYGLSALYRLYEAKNGGWVFFAAPSTAEWDLFVDCIAAEFADDERFAIGHSRALHDAELAAALARLFSSKTALEWEAACAPIGVGCVAVFNGTIGEFSCTDPAIREAGLTVEVESTRFGRYLRHGPPVTLRGIPARLAACCEVGEHTIPILAELGYEDHEIAEFLAAGVAGAADLSTVSPARPEGS
jgi:crotonobetainyl-CoA:carnitine CoA-transferase CaiB-like acyl-CoA transferase